MYTMAKNENKIQSVVKKGYPVQVCKYNELKDAEEVVNGLGVDIDDMLKTGIVQDSSETLDNNGIEDPNSIIGRIRDVFDAMDAERIIKKYGKKAPKKAEAGVEELTD